MTLVDDLIAKLVADAVLPAASIFEGPRAQIPAGGGPFCVISETGGTASYRLQNASYPQPSAQLMFYGASKATLRPVVFAAHASLTVWNTTINGTWYMRLVPTQEPFDMPPDANDRSRMAFNVGITKAP